MSAPTLSPGVPVAVQEQIDRRREVHVWWSEHGVWVDVCAPHAADSHHRVKEAHQRVSYLQVTTAVLAVVDEAVRLAGAAIDRAEGRA